MQQKRLALRYDSAYTILLFRLVSLLYLSILLHILHILHYLYW